MISDYINRNIYFILFCNDISKTIFTIVEILKLNAIKHLCNSGINYLVTSSRLHLDFRDI